MICRGQFAPPAGQPGSTAIYKDSSVIVGWALTCEVTRGFQDISNPSLGYATTGDSSMATGPAGTNGVVSLGDGGFAIVTFENPVTNGSGWDFAVFENGFSDTFLELAFVEVSSDGINFFRFPATSYTQDTSQIGGFGSVDATKINNLAGKYRALYGTPFDLEELNGTAGLDINNITHIKIQDAIGCINPLYASYDQYGNAVNDPWNTPFPEGGFDLDAVGVIHYSGMNINNYVNETALNLFPNPAKNLFYIEWKDHDCENVIIQISNLAGKIEKIQSLSLQKGINRIDSENLPSGVYFISLQNNQKIYNGKIILQNE